MTYSCARFADPAMSLTDAQTSKHDLVCRKLGLHERTGMRLLDVGCGWGSMAIHAAREYGVDVLGVTLSREQVETARQRVQESGLTDRGDRTRDVEGKRVSIRINVGGGDIHTKK